MINKQPTDLYGLVLAGGKSSRMGSDKSELVYHGVPQKDYLFNLLEKFCTQVFTSCRADGNSLNYQNPIPDLYDFNSPLNGILSALCTYPESAWLCVAVDMPFIDERVLQYLIDHRDSKKYVTCFYDSSGKYPEPLVTIWEKKCCPELEEFSKNGKLSPREFLAQVEIKILTAPVENAFFNVNDRASFDEATRVINN